MAKKKTNPLVNLIRGQTPAGKRQAAKRADRAFRSGRAAPASAAIRHAGREVSPFKAAKQAAKKTPRGGATGGR